LLDTLPTASSPALPESYIIGSSLLTPTMSEELSEIILESLALTQDNDSAMIIITNKLKSFLFIFTPTHKFFIYMCSFTKKNIRKIHLNHILNQ